MIHPKYRPDIDGLRAIAIMAVVIFHAFPGVIPGGFIGVDIFFVISGFLISTIVFSSIAHDRYNMMEFYVRRVLRIFPSLLVVIISCLIFGWFVLYSDEFKQLGKHIASSAGFIQNFTLYRESGYFDNSAETKPLLHLWSLAIEEQFYIFWPLLLAFVWRSQWSFLKITAGIATVSFAANINLVLNGLATEAFYLPLSRFWELMIGGVLAYVVLHRPQLILKHQQAQSFLGLTLIIVGVLLVNKSASFPGWLALLPTVGAFFIISAGPGAWINEKILASKLMVWVGLISYPLYLWHWPLLSFAQIISGEIPSKFIRIAALALAVLLAWLTYKVVELPIKGVKRKSLFASMLLVLMLVVLSVGVAIKNQLLAPRNNSITLEKIVSAVGDWDYPKGFMPVENAPEGVFELNSNVEETTLFFGDSHIEQYGPKVEKFVRENPDISTKVIFVTSGGCPPIPGVLEDSSIHSTCKATREYGLNLIRDNNVRTVVIGASWNGYFVSLIKPPIPAEQRYYFADGNQKHYFSEGKGVGLALLQFEELLHKIGGNKRVVLLLDNPIDERFNPSFYVKGNRFDSNGSAMKPVVDLVPMTQDQIKLKREFIEIANRQYVEYIDTTSMHCTEYMCKAFSEDGRPIYKDSGHFRPYYVKENATFIEGLVLRQRR